MIDILIEGMTGNRGGKESYILNMVHSMDGTRYRFSFVAYDEKIACEDALRAEGREIIHIPLRHAGLMAHRRALRKLLRTHHFDVVWAHKTTLSACELLSIARSCGVPVRVVHSHCSSNMGGKFTYVMHVLNRLRIYRLANVQLACSETAAEWFFGKRPAAIARNGVDLERFRFRQEVRERMREELGLEDCLTLGHVGRFSVEKNHKKLLNVFHAYKLCRPDAKLVLCGDGEERPNIEAQIRELRLEDSVILLGTVGNVHEILQAIDVLMMPSLFEGLPFALIEAQAAGLKCVVSDAVSRESDVLGWNQFLPLDAPDEVWAKAMLNVRTDYDRGCGYADMRAAGFDLQDSARKMEELLETRLNSRR